MHLSLRAKFLLLSGLVQALVLSLLIWNSLRLMDQAVSRNADRVAHEYAVTLNLSLSPYASSGRLDEMRSYLGEMLADPRDSFVRYIAILDAAGRPLLQVGALPPAMGKLFQGEHVQLAEGMATTTVGALLHARAPLLLKDNQIGRLHFGVSTEDLAQARSQVLTQGSMISALGFVAGLLLFYLFTSGIGRRLNKLTARAERLAKGDFSLTVPEYGGDELEVFSHSLNTLSGALRHRIADLELAERRLRESEARFQVLFDTAPVALTVTDKEGVLMAANQALSRSFGHEAQAILGKRTSEIRFWSDPLERERIWGVYKRDGIVRGEIAQVRFANGQTGDVSIWSSTLELGGEKSVVWALLDMSEEFKAKRALKDLNVSLESRVKQRSAELERANGELSKALDRLTRTQHELVASEKMASLGSLVAGIAHELNTPIGNSLLAATTLTDHVAAFRALVETGSLKRSELNTHMGDLALACSLISGSLQKASHLIASFKQVAVDQTNDQRREFDLRQVLDDTLATFSPRLRRANCRAEIKVEEGLSMNSYAGSLCQVVNNLVTNALTHAFEERSEGLILISARAMGDKIELRFDDDGQGMSEEALHHIFDPFFTTKMGRGGTGLGMHIVYNIVTGILGGHVHVTTRLGQGSSVILLVPRQALQRRSAPESLVGK